MRLCSVLSRRCSTQAIHNQKMRNCTNNLHQHVTIAQAGFRRVRCWLLESAWMMENLMPSVKVLYSKNVSFDVDSGYFIWLGDISLD